jgi:hypothetical protein
MIRHMLRAIAVLTLACPVIANATSGAFSFGVIAIGTAAPSGEMSLRTTISESDKDNLAFVVSNGIKTMAEPCDDVLYSSRRDVLESAQNGLILSLTASDWSDCKRPNGRSAAIERLTRLRESFFAEPFSFGATRIPLIRQSLAPKFRSYGENARWKVGDFLFATINLPANNNHFLAEAGRNGEFEDRLIANRDWLQKTFVLAARKDIEGIVLFSDGNPLEKPSAAMLARLPGRRDGFQEIRQAISTLAKKFPGKILLVYNKPRSRKTISGEITWQGNIGQMQSRPGWTKITADPNVPALFIVEGQPSRGDSERP